MSLFVVEEAASVVSVIVATAELELLFLCIFETYSDRLARQPHLNVLIANGMYLQALIYGVFGAINQIKLIGYFAFQICWQQQLCHGKERIFYPTHRPRIISSIGEVA